MRLVDGCPTLALQRLANSGQGLARIDEDMAVLELLCRPRPKSGAPTLGALLDAARSKTCRIWAENSPFESKDVLKARGYRWNGDPSVAAEVRAPPNTLLSQVAG